MEDNKPPRITFIPLCREMQEEKKYIDIDTLPKTTMPPPSEDDIYRDIANGVRYKLEGDTLVPYEKE